ncbi:Imm32 family immunity protein [Streptomyces tritici]|uniref:Imm32 family immunity protein n=1 Tax=Streptomyces tritici TaxID=2054410 RepID=UPI003AEFC2B9
MDRTIDVPEYPTDGGGLRFAWDDGFEIEVVAGSTEVIIKANAAGLTSLARHLLTLAQDGVRPGAHLHLTADQEIDSAVDLILERAPETSE